MKKLRSRAKPAKTVPANTITFHCGATPAEEIMRLDKDGMAYKGQRIEDAGHAYRAFLEVMRVMTPRPSKRLKSQGKATR